MFFFFLQMTGTTQQNTKTPQVHIPAATAAGNTSVSVTLDPQAQLESDKRAVYRFVQSPTIGLCFRVYWVNSTPGARLFSFDIEL